MGLLGPRLHAVVEVALPVSRVAGLARLRAATAAHRGPFRLVSRLSGGGAIVRALAAPPTDQPFFGELTAERLRFARVPRATSISPWAPIARGAWEAAPGGARLRLTLAPHPQAGLVGELASIFALPLAVVGVAALGSAPGYAAALLVWVGAMVGLPRWWARRVFTAEVDGFRAALDAALANPVPGEDDPPPVDPAQDDDAPAGAAGPP